jgi:hypothetical protein
MENLLNKERKEKDELVQKVIFYFYLKIKL